MTVEEFGIEEFGCEEFGAEPEPQQQSVADLEAMLEDLNKQIASTMDELEIQRLRNAKKAILDQMNTSSKTTGQWSDLGKAYNELYGAKNPWKEKFAEYGGMCDECYEKLRHELAEANSAKDKASKPRPGRRGGVAKTNIPAPDERFAAAMQHAANLGLDGQLIFDELELQHDAAGMDALVAEINARAAVPDAPVSESNDSGDTPVQAAAPAVYFEDIAIQGLIDATTGEVSGRDWLLDKLGWTQFPATPSKAEADAVVDLLLTTYLGPAARYKSIAADRAAPLEKRANDLLRFFKPYLDACGKAYLPTHKNDAKVDAKSQHKAGDYKEKTLKLNSGAISWEKAGGPSLVNPPRFYAWVAEKKTEMLALRDKGTPEALEEMKGLENKYGFQLVTELKFDTEKCKAALAPGYEDLPIDHFASCKIK